jgi:hypothetical protein
MTFSDLVLTADRNLPVVYRQSLILQKYVGYYSIKQLY